MKRLLETNYERLGKSDAEEFTRDFNEILDLAMKALEQESVIDKIRAEIESIIGEHNWDDYDFCSGLICARKILDKYKAESEEV